MAISPRRALVWLAILVCLPIVFTLGYLQLMVRYDERDPAHAFIVDLDNGPTDYSYVILFFIGFPLLQFGIFQLRKWNERRRAQSSQTA